MGAHGRPHAGRVCVACAHAAGLHAGKRPTANVEPDGRGSAQTWSHSHPATGSSERGCTGRVPSIRSTSQGRRATSSSRGLPAKLIDARLCVAGRLARSSRRTKGPQDRSAATSDVRGLLARPRCPPIRGHTSSVPRHGLLGVGCLKQLPKPICQQFDGLLQGAELPNSDYRDGSVQVKRWGTQDFHGIDRTIPGNKASG
jgi:hypothetical protein